MFEIIIADTLPYCIRVLLESAVRNCDNFQVKETDVENIINWTKTHTDPDGTEIAFKPARVILQVCFKNFVLTKSLVYYVVIGSCALFCATHDSIAH